MENKTNETVYLYKESVWYGNMIISIICLSISFYVLCALISYEEKVENWRKVKFFKQSKAKKYRIISRLLSLSIAVFSLTRHATTTTLVWLEAKPSPDEDFSHLPNMKQVCKHLPRAGIFFLSIGLSIVHLFLWYRQRIFYIHPALKLLNNPVIQKISNLIYVIWVIYAVSMCAIYFIFVRYEFNDVAGCLVAKDTLTAYEFIIGSWALSSLFMQGILLCLFVHPLIKRASWSGQTPSQRILLQQSVKKAVILAVICLASDICIPVLTYMLVMPNENDMYTICNFNIVINQFVVVACFDQWKTMLWPWGYLKNGGPNFSWSMVKMENQI